MAGEDKPPQPARHRKKNKKSRSKGKSPGGSPGGHFTDSQDELVLPPVLQPRKLQEEKPKVSVAKMEEESSTTICLQVLLPYLLAGMGMVMAGMVLDNVQVSSASYSPTPQKNLHFNLLYIFLLKLHCHTWTL